MGFGFWFFVVVFVFSSGHFFLHVSPLFSPSMLLFFIFFLNVT